MADHKASLIVTLKDEASQAIGGLRSKFSSLTDSIFNLKNLVVGLIAGGTLKNLYETFDRNSDSISQMEAVLSSTQGEVGLTKDEILKLNKSLSDQYAISETVINSGTNMLLTFKNIKGDQFKEATDALINMNSAMTHGNVTSESLSSQAIQLGKALNYPTIGLQALTRMGVQFSDAQKEQINQFIKMGDVASAQKIILSELKSEFGGSAEAYVDGAQKTGVAIEKMKITLGELVSFGIEGIGTLLGAFNKLPDGVQKGIVIFTGLTVAIGAFVSIVPTVVAGFAAIGVAGLAAFGWVAGVTVAISGLVTAIMLLHKEAEKPLKAMNTDELKKSAKETKETIEKINTELAELLTTAIPDQNVSIQNNKNLQIKALKDELSEKKKQLAEIEAAIKESTKKQTGYTINSAEIQKNAASEASQSIVKNLESQLKTIELKNSDTAKNLAEIGRLSKEQHVGLAIQEAQQKIATMESILQSEKLTSDDRIRLEQKPTDEKKNLNVIQTKNLKEQQDNQVQNEVNSTEETLKIEAEKNKNILEGLKNLGASFADLQTGLKETVKMAIESNDGVFGQLKTSLATLLSGGNTGIASFFTGLFSGTIIGGITSVITGIFGGAPTKTVAEHAEEMFDKMVDKTNDKLDDLGREKTVTSKSISLLEDLKKTGATGISTDLAKTLGVSTTNIDDAMLELAKTQKKNIENTVSQNESDLSNAKRAAEVAQQMEDIRHRYGWQPGAVSDSRSAAAKEEYAKLAKEAETLGVEEGMTGVEWFGQLKALKDFYSKLNTEFKENVLDNLSELSDLSDYLNLSDLGFERGGIVPKIPRAQSGLVVGGNSNTGDNVIIRANSGEEIYTVADRKQVQSTLSEINTKLNAYFSNQAQIISIQIDGSEIARATAKYQASYQSKLKSGVI